MVQGYWCQTKQLIGTNCDTELPITAKHYGYNYSAICCHSQTLIWVSVTIVGLVYRVLGYSQSYVIYFQNRYHHFKMYIVHLRGVGLSSLILLQFSEKFSMFRRNHQFP